MVSHVVNMRLISKSFIFSLSMLVMLSNTIYSQQEKSQNHIKSATYVSQKFEVGPGKVSNRPMIDIEFPKGHIGVKSFDLDLVDEQGNSVPLYETYIHHWSAIRFFKKMNMSDEDRAKPYGGSIFKRNAGTCNGGILPHYWGFGSESRGTTTKIPNPFAVELGNPTEIPEGFEEKWMFDLMFIDTRGTENMKSCSECRCDQFELPENFYNVTFDINFRPLSHDYKGGIFCCKDNFQCKMRKGFQAPTRKLALRYKVTWVDWDQHQIPLRFYVLDSTDRVRINGSQITHDCQVEYTIPNNNGSDHVHVQKASIPIDKGGYLIFSSAHMHTGVINATLYRQDGRTLCTSTSRYGTGKKAGNEKGYLVGMSACYPKLGSIKIKDGETLIVESRYKNEFLTGAMGHMYVYLADRLPQAA